MAIYVNEQNMIEQNTFLYEDRIKSPTSRFLDTTPTFVTYYHINDIESTTDVGFKDVKSIIGTRSPIRFNKIENFPLYGIEQIVLQLSDTEYGLDSEYESEGIILPGTIKPLMNDFFVINVSGNNYVFRVNNFQYDAIMSDNFYKITFSIHSSKDDEKEKIEKQVIDENVCILENIGTEENCIIEKKTFVEIGKIDGMYRIMIDFYKAMFYNERHNVFLCNYQSDKYLYDPYQTYFINKYGLFNEKNSLSSLVLTEEIDDPKQKYHYNKSMYKLIEMRDLNLLDTFKFCIVSGTSLVETSFYRWYENSIYILQIPYDINSKNNISGSVFSEEFKEAIKLNIPLESEHATLIQKYLRNEDLSISDISLSLADELIDMNNTLEVFFITPVIMYIIRNIIEKSIRVKK